MTEDTPKPAQTILDRNAIVALDDRRVALIDVPEWGGAVRARQLSVRDREEVELALKLDEKNTGGTINKHMAVYVAASLVTETGERMFDAEDVETILKSKNGAVIDTLYARLRQLNGLDLDDDDSPGK